MICISLKSSQQSGLIKNLHHLKGIICHICFQLLQRKKSTSWPKNWCLGCLDWRKRLSKISSSSADSEDLGLEACLASSERNSKKVVEQKAYNLAEDKYFERTENLSPNLKLLYNALRQISPTSVPSEREFSVSGGVMTKKRTRLRDETLDKCFLKSTYKKEPKGIALIR